MPTALISLTARERGEIERAIAAFVERRPDRGAECVGNDPSQADRDARCRASGYLRRKSNAYSNFVASRAHGGSFPRELLPGELYAAGRQIGTDYHGGLFPGELLFGELSAAR